jgi:hypothetical protein
VLDSRRSPRSRMPELLEEAYLCELENILSVLKQP